MKDQPLDPETAGLIAYRFRALGDPARLLVLDHLRRNGEMAVGEIAARGVPAEHVQASVGPSPPSEIIARRKHGTKALYRVADPSVRDLCDVALAARRQQPPTPDTL